jgi:peroxiredoxin
MESEDFKMKIGSPAIEIDLVATDTRNYMLRYFHNKDFIVMVFTCNHCPYAQAYEDRLIHLSREFSKRAVFLAINSNDETQVPEDSYSNMVIRAAEKQFPFLYLHDPDQKVARAYGAIATPHVFVFDASGRLAYQGGIDNNWENEAGVTEHYLRDALTALSEGRLVIRRTAPVVGCSIKWKQ